MNAFSFLRRNQSRRRPSPHEAAKHRRQRRCLVEPLESRQLFSVSPLQLATAQLAALAPTSPPAAIMSATVPVGVVNEPPDLPNNRVQAKLIKLDKNGNAVINGRYTHNDQDWIKFAAVGREMVIHFTDPARITLWCNGKLVNPQAGNAGLGVVYKVTPGQTYQLCIDCKWPGASNPFNYTVTLKTSKK